MYSYNTTAGTQIFYAWDKATGINAAAERWLMEENQFDSDFPSVPQNPGTSLAVHIIKNIFKLPLADENTNIGGYLPGYDIQNREPYQMIQLSLATELTNRRFVECYMNENGKVDFYPIGESGAGISSDVLYSTDSANYSQKCENVIIEGYDPPLKKFTRGTYDIFEMAKTYFSLEMKKVGDPKYDPILDGKAPTTDPQSTYPLKYCLGDMMDVEACKYFQEGYIVYGDPGLTDAEKMTTGNNAVYKTKEFEEVLEWIYDVNIPWFNQSSTEVTFEARSPYYHKINNFGKLFNRQWTPAGTYVTPICQSWQDVNTTDPNLGIDLPMSDCARFNGVKEVILYGFNIKVLQLDETLDTVTGNIKKGDYDFVVDIDTIAHEPIRLVEGEDYVVVKKDTTNLYKIIFLCSLNPNIRKRFDGVPTGTDKVERLPKIRLSPSCVNGPTPGTPPTSPEGTKFTSWWDILKGEGFLRDNITRVAPGDNDTFTDVVIFPTGEGTTGYGMLKNKGKIFVVYDWEAPCVHFKDFNNTVTVDNLNRVSIKLHPIIQKDLPRPIAICNKGNTTMLDPRETIPDYSYGSVQNLTTSNYQKAMDALENGDVHLTLPFIACEKNSWEPCQELMNAASFIYSLQKQVINTTTYVCKPNANPILGRIMKGSGSNQQIINSIDYSYQDSSQYLITVNAGPIWQGFGGWDQSIYQNKTERVQVEGVVREVHWSNSRASVWLERIGMLECVNAIPDMLEIGDVVKVTLYNNPISI
jgi:hypothetical protein